MMDVFSFVDLLFIVDPPRKADGGSVVHEHVDFDLFSFVQASGVEVFVRSSLSGLFLVDLHDMVTCVIMYEVGGVRKRIGGVYVPPKTNRLEWLACEATWDNCDFLIGNFNAKHDEWNPNPKHGSMNIADSRGMWLTWLCNQNISKNSGLHSERPVHQTHRTPERQSRIRTQPWYHTTHQTQPNAAPKTQDAPDAAPKTQDTPDAAPNTQDAT